MEENVDLDKQLLFDAAKGKTEALANWIESNMSMEGIPYQLVAELIRNSKGCMKNVSVHEIYNTEYESTVNEQGQVERYISRQQGICHFLFPGQTKPKGRPDAAERNREIFEAYKELKKQGLDAEYAYQKLSTEYSLAIDTIADIVKRERAEDKDYLKILSTLPNYNF